MSFREILEAVAETESTPTIGRGIELRMRFARLVNRQLKRKGWKQKKLAEAAKKAESYISNIINGNQNLTFDLAGEILFALNVGADFVADNEMATKDEGS